MDRAEGRGQWNIPQDWDGVSWACWQLYWPASDQWQNLLRAILYTLTRGRTWRADSGSIRDAQGTGWAIFDANVPLNPCAGAPQTAFAAQYGGGAIIESEDDMGQVVTNVYVAGGQLVVEYGPCCVRKYPISALGSDTGGPFVVDDEGKSEWSDPDVPYGYDVDPDTVSDDVVCKVSANLARAMRRVHDEIEDVVADVVAIPWGPGRIAERLPEYTLDKGYLAEALALYVTAFTAGGALNLVLNKADQIEQGIAHYLTSVVPRRYSISATDYLTIQMYLYGFGAWQEMDIDLEAGFVGLYWATIWLALGRGTANELANAARQFAAGQYNCDPVAWVTVPNPDDAMEPIEGGWYLGPNIAETASIGFEDPGSHQFNVGAVFTPATPCYGVYAELTPFSYVSGNIKRGITWAEVYTRLGVSAPTLQCFAASSDTYQSQGVQYGFPMIAMSSDNAVARTLLAGQMGWYGHCYTQPKAGIWDNAAMSRTESLGWCVSTTFAGVPFTRLRQLRLIYKD